VISSSGVIYGTTAAGGASGLGTIFSLSPPSVAGGTWSETELYSFGGNGYGAGSKGTVVLGPEGVLYGTTQYGGNSNLGTVFALKPPAAEGSSWTYSVLYSFKTGGDGNYPVSGLVSGKGSTGQLVLYGTTAAGGVNNLGAVFSLAPPASSGSAWTEAVLYSFAGGTDGSNPASSPAIGNGWLYGTTSAGGSSNTGTVFSLAPPSSPGGSWTETVIHAFPAATGQVLYPGPLAYRQAGLYGVTEFGGPSGAGTVFILKVPASPGGSWTLIPLYTFKGGANGSLSTGLVPSSGGVVYGTTYAGGAHGYGTVFALAL
jgi:uncharacterized repeat protein (TIGR03803 family)